MKRDKQLKFESTNNLEELPTKEEDALTK